MTEGEGVRDYDGFIADNDACAVIMAIASELTAHLRPEIQQLTPGRGGIYVANFEPGQKIAVHTTGGDPAIGDPNPYAQSLVNRLVAQAQVLGAEPVGFADTLDMQAFDTGVGRAVLEGIVTASEAHNVVCMNGETAGLFDIVTVPGNLSGTMISMIDTDKPEGVYEKDGVQYIILEPKGPVFLNADGVGTKVLIYQRTRMYTLADVLAMLVDDTGRINAELAAVSLHLELSKGGSVEDTLRKGIDPFSQLLGAPIAMAKSIVGNRVQGYGRMPYYLGGVAVSYIDRKVLRNLPRPRAGEVLVGIRDRKNRETSRSNGISVLRHGSDQLARYIADEVYHAAYNGEWHEYELPESGSTIGQLASTPSTVFYPHVRKLFAEKLISWFAHNSGGAWRDKIGKPIRDQGLSATITPPYDMPQLQRAIFKLMGKSDEPMTPGDFYKTFTAGTEGVVSVKPNRVPRLLARLTEMGLEGRVCSTPLEARARPQIKICSPIGNVIYN